MSMYITYMILNRHTQVIHYLKSLSSTEGFFLTLIVYSKALMKPASLAISLPPKP